MNHGAERFGVVEELMSATILSRIQTAAFVTQESMAFRTDDAMELARESAGFDSVLDALEAVLHAWEMTGI